MRITVEQIIHALAGGVSEDDLLADYPVLEPEDIRAALAYAGMLVSEHRAYKVG